MEFNKDEIERMQLEEEKLQKIKEQVEKNVGLNAIRPAEEDRVLWAKMLELAEQTEGKKVSQTDLFSIMLKEYLKSTTTKEENNLLNFKQSHFSIAYHAERLVSEFVDMEKKAQEAITAVKNNFDTKELVNLNKIEELTTKVGVLEKENSKLVEDFAMQLEEAMAKRIELEEKLKGLEEENKELKDRIVVNTGVAEKDKVRIETLENATGKLKEENQSLKGEVDALIAKIKSTGDTNSKLESKVKDLETTLVEKEATYNKQIAAAAENNAFYANTIKELQSNIAAIEKTYKDALEQNKKAAEDKLKEEKAAVRELGEELKEQKAVAKEIAELKIAKIEAEYSLKISKVEAAGAEEIKDLKKKIEELELEISNSKKTK